MIWLEDDEQEASAKAPDDVLDLSFKVSCRSLPLDHAWSLSQALQEKLPWLVHEPYAGINLIHGAESGNGWIRPDGPDDVLFLSRRTRLHLRLPKTRVEDASELSGLSLEVSGRALKLGATNIRPLSLLTTLFTRHLALDEVEDEDQFLRDALELLRAKGIRVKKMMSGRSHRFELPDGPVTTRSLMVDGLSVEDSLKLQREGLGPGRITGFGIFLPHKGIDSVPAAK